MVRYAQELPLEPIHEVDRYDMIRGDLLNHAVQRSQFLPQHLMMQKGNGVDQLDEIVPQMGAGQFMNGVHRTTPFKEEPSSRTRIYVQEPKTKSQKPRAKSPIGIWSCIASHLTC